MARNRKSFRQFFASENQNENRQTEQNGGGGSPDIKIRINESRKTQTRQNGINDSFIFRFAFQTVPETREKCEQKREGETRNVSSQIRKKRVSNAAFPKTVDRAESDDHCASD